MSEELVKRLRTAAQWADKGLCIPPCLCLEAADAIEEREKKLYSQDITVAQILAMYTPLFVPQWIPVTERLPEIDEKHHCSKDVLVYLDGGYMAFSALEENIFGQTWFECERHPDVEEEMKVTHWMPLPEPPMEE